MIKHSRQADALDLFQRLSIKKDKRNESVHHEAAFHQPEGARPKFCAALCSGVVVEKRPSSQRIKFRTPARESGITDFPMVAMEGRIRCASLTPKRKQKMFMNHMSHVGIQVCPIMSEEEEPFFGGNVFVAMDSSASSSGGIDSFSNCVSRLLWYCGKIPSLFLPTIIMERNPSSAKGL